MVRHWQSLFCSGKENSELHYLYKLTVELKVESDLEKMMLVKCNLGASWIKKSKLYGDGHEFSRSFTFN